MGRKLNDITGQRFGRLVAVEHPYKTSSWVCVCDCGNVKTVTGNALKKGDTKSCGCLNRELSAARKRTHGKYGTPEYISWAHAKSRCTNPNNQRYKHYGGRGITMCEQWMNSFEDFFAHVGPKPSPKHSLDRIDVNKGYEPGNVRWATPTTQANNHQKHRFVEIDGKRKTIAEAARESGLKYATVYTRINREKWSDEKAIKTPKIDPSMKYPRQH